MIGRIVFAFLLFAVAFWFGIFGLWVSDREVPVTGISSMLLNNNVAPGDIVKIKITAYRIRSCRTTIERYIEDSSQTRFLFPDVDYLNPGPPGNVSTIIEVAMPPRITSGIATLKTNAAWECNPVHKVWPIIDRQPDIAIMIK